MNYHRTSIIMLLALFGLALSPLHSVDVLAQRGTHGDWRCWPEEWTPWCADSYSDTIWNDVDFVDENNGWMVGRSGRLARWNGVTWSNHVISSSDIRLMQ